MALIDCPHCSKSVSDLATVCPHCGKQIADDSSNHPQIDKTKWQYPLWIMLKISGVLYLVSLLLFLALAVLNYISLSQSGSFSQSEITLALTTIRNIVAPVCMLLAFFSIGMAISNKIIKIIVIVMWLAMASWFLCTFWGIHTVYPQLHQLQMWYRFGKLLFLVILLLNLERTSLALPISLYIIESIFYIIQPIIPVDVFVYCHFWGDSVILNLFFAIYYMLLSKTSWRKVFNRANNH